MMRLLAAEEHAVELCYGRASVAQLAGARTRNEAVLLIWSAGAPTAHYMTQWARSIDPDKLIEIASDDAWPQISRRPNVIDFNAWGGERGGSAWRALTERLKAIARASEPPKPAPHRAAMVLALASVAAVAGALAERVYDAHHMIEAPPDDLVAEGPLFSDEGQGGALIAIEPGAAEAGALRLSRPAALVQPLAPVDGYALEGGDAAPSMAFAQNNPSMLDRFTSFAAPFLRGDGDAN
jgi:hypothetical protein